MTATMKTAILPIRQTLRAPDSSSAFSLEEVLASITVNRIPDEYAKLPGFLRVLVLIAESAVYKTTIAKKLVSDQAARVNDNWVNSTVATASEGPV